MNNCITNKQIREKIKSICKCITSEESDKMAIAAANFLVTTQIFYSSKNIAVYLSMPIEMKTLPIIKAIWDNNKSCYVPIILDNNLRSLDFVPFNKSSKLIKNKYNIDEPIYNNEKINPSELDLVIAPLSAFDKHGNRFGKGGGYYDRAFSFLINEKRPAKPFLCGLAFSCQEVDELPKMPWDVPLDAILTEKGFYIF